VTQLPPGFTVRRPSPDDIDAVVALLRACDLEDIGVEDTPRDWIHESWDGPFVDVDRDVLLVDAPDGALAAYGELQSFDETASAEVFMRTHPASTGRGLATVVLDRLQARARERLKGPDPGALPFRANAAEPNRAARALLEARGMREIRRFLHMEKVLGGPPPTPPVPPAGVRFRVFDPERDWETFHRVVEDGFADHWGWERVSLDEFRRSFEAPGSWDPGLVCFAETDGATAGVVASTLVTTPGHGWVGDLTVLPPYRGRGIARALLARTFADLAERGCSVVRLNVDATNETGATRLYEAAGMTLHRTWVLFEQPVGAA
jgi:mycothiol synthase